jgi:hypothetical protein
MNGLVSSALGAVGSLTLNSGIAEKEEEEPTETTETTETEKTETEETVEELKEDFDEADKAAMKSQQKKIETQTNQSTALEERINILRAISEKGMTKGGVE